MNAEETPPTRVDQSAPTRAQTAAASATPGYLQPGSELGGYQLIEVLGTGGMGQVFRAVDADGVEVAMKVLHPHLSRDEEARERLRREVSALHRVRGDRVARVLDAEADGMDAFIVTELLNGLTLDQSVREEGVFAGEELVQLAQDLSQALHAIHGADVVHRDLKPSNVMLTEDGAKLIDFGIAQVGDESRITQTGLVVGTAGYLAPEVFSGSPPTTEGIDWYAWAAVLLYAATGNQPFGTGPFQAVLARMERLEPVVDGLAPGVAAGLRAGLHPDPALRAHPAQVLRQLQHPDVVLDEISQTKSIAPAPAVSPPMVAVPYHPTEIQPTEFGGETGTRYGDEPGGADATFFGPVVPPPPQHPPAPPAARLVLLSLLLLTAAAGAGLPVVALPVLVVALWLARTTGLARVAQFRRRMRRGSKDGGVGGLVLRLPWYLVRGAGGLVLPLLLSLFCFALILGLAWVGVWATQETGGGDVDSELVRRAIVSGAGGLGLLISALIMWRWDTVPITGRSGQPLDYDGATRVGARVIIHTVAPNSLLRMVWALVIIIGAALVFFFSLSSAEWFDIFDFLGIGFPGS